MGSGANEAGAADTAGGGAGLSRNFVLLAALWLALGAGLVAVPAMAGVLTFLFVASGWILSVCVHEFGHAFVAYRAGDHSVVKRGYLSLAPLRYTDLGTTVILPLIALAMGGIGFPGAAVYLRPDLMRSPLGRSLASLAGPVMTGVVLLVLSIALRLIPPNIAPELYCAVAFLALLQATGLILNMLPVPGLDGYGVLCPFLPKAVQQGLRPFERVSTLLLVAALFLAPGVSGKLFDAAFGMAGALGVPNEAVSVGYRQFTFWRSLAPGG
jgi:Zn-dependent protease